MTDLPKGYENMEITNFETLGLDAKPWDMTHKDILNVPTVIYSYTEIDTRFGKGMLCQCVVDGEVKKILMGSIVLMRQLDQIKAKMPVRVTIIRQGRYYKFS